MKHRVYHVSKTFGLHSNCKRLVTTTVEYFIKTTFTNYASTHSTLRMLEHGGPEAILITSGV
jgi:hypothetical protein